MGEKVHIDQRDSGKARKARLTTSVSRRQFLFSMLGTLLGVIVTACTRQIGIPATSTTASQLTKTATKTVSPTLTTASQPTETVTETESPITRPGFQKGVVLFSTQPGDFSSPYYDQTVAQLIKPMGVDWLQLSFGGYQDGLDSTDIRFDKEFPGLFATDSDIRHAVTYAHSQGLKVMVKPLIVVAKKLANGQFTEDPNHWRGQIDFGQDTTAWQAWFDSYTKFIIHYASLAQELDVDYFSVGTELGSAAPNFVQGKLQPATRGPALQANHWKDVVAKVRSVYHGPLTYAPGPSEEMAVTWWDVLDAIGIDAYYPLTNIDDPTVQQLKAAWAPYIAILAGLHYKYNLPIIITEVGYQARRGTNLTPGDTYNHNVDLQTQADCCEALFEAFSAQDWWLGVYWWGWTADPHQGGFNDPTHNFNNRPAENVLRAFYGAPLLPTPLPRPAAVPAVGVDETNQSVIYQGGLEPGWTANTAYATVDLDSSDVLHDGHRVLKISMTSWNGIVFYQHQPVDISHFYWMEFYIYVGSDVARQLAIVAVLPSGFSMPNVDIGDPGYLEGGKFIANQWQRVLIPLKVIAGGNTTVAAFNIHDWSGVGETAFYLDGIRLLGAKAP